MKHSVLPYLACLSFAWPLRALHGQSGRRSPRETTCAAAAISRSAWPCGQFSHAAAAGCPNRQAPRAEAGRSGLHSRAPSSDKASPADLGKALGPAGVNLGEVLNRYNQMTADARGDIIPVDVTIFEDRSFTFIMKTPPASNLIMKAIGLQKGSANPLTTKVGKITAKQITEIAEKKMQDLNATTMAAAEKIIKGTARSMGVEVVE